MDIVVCLKRVPLTQEVDFEVDLSGKRLKTADLAFVVNDWDNYAIEEAILINEKLGGSITAVTVGREDDEEVLRRALAMGADRAIRVDPEDLEVDPSVVARLLAQVIKSLPHDLVLTGVQADDDNCSMVGVLVAEYLGLAHASVVTAIDPSEREASLRLELEGGIDEQVKIRLPALLTVQTGINEPRYVSVMGIRKARKKELNVLKATELSLGAEELLPQTFIEEMYLPPEVEGAEMIDGDPSSVAEELLRIMKEKGVIG
jgi:electron transfer flavoprotein beta subunit